mgnify:CR=1 FL=1
MRPTFEMLGDGDGFAVTTDVEDFLTCCRILRSLQLVENL